jgi:putative sporulation protein YtxC
MPLLILVYKDEREEIIDGIKSTIGYFKKKHIHMGVSEKMESDAHFLKIFSDCKLNERLKNIFYTYISYILYNIIVDEFYKKDINKFLDENYFFLQNDERESMKKESLRYIKGNVSLIDENSIYCINKKNKIIEYIKNSINENNSINIEGFITFRMKNMLDDIESIIDKVIEKYMVEREYDEFIKLLKYFVEIQESKIDYIDIEIKEDGSYIIKDKYGKNITKELYSELAEFRNGDYTKSEDLLISALITNSPERISIHCTENCKNEEVIDTIKNVFTDRVKFYRNCKI